VVDVATGRLLRTLHVRVPGTDGSQRWLTLLSADPSGRMAFLAWKHGRGAVQPGQNPTVVAPAMQEIVAVDLATGTVTGPVDTGEYQATISWSADGTRAVIARQSGLLRVVDARTLRPLTPLVPAANGYVQAATLSPDGSTVLTAGTDGTIAFWDSSRLQRLGAPIQLSTQAVWAWYDSDGNVHGMIAEHGSTRSRWFTVAGTPSAWLADACRVAGRDLTSAEWRQYVANRPYQPTCG